MDVPPKLAEARVLIADGHPLVIRGIRHLLESEPDIELVGEFSSRTHVAQGILDLRPDIAILETGAPGLCGIDLIRQLAVQASTTFILALSAHEERVYAQQILVAGARGYVVKRSPSETLLQAVRAVRYGGLFLDPALAGQATEAGLLENAHPSEGGPSGLTSRERAVVKLVAQGFTNKEAALALGISMKSVETYRVRAGDKLHTRSRAKFMQYAVMQGWISVGVQ
ncbi:Oxygen regulatory protein NreC [Methylobacterium crusticola]|uniref:Oxygen regulatory protein NreC n=1 Tax=Methylobacterium crusticola TaxID=1697972 RepID=A0ABQ4R656_9HYPH|nr:response regulator transcription factor [Methylobacterium crusticola]GJD52655.1 Oxygen regulatory protein NreC [Methylobacterium crusticola]